MPAISKIRLTNVIYEEGNKRYNDELFLFEGHNGAILLENGGGKTVLIQTALQAILPHVELADRKIKDTLQLENAPAHIAIEWITNEDPRQYVVTAVSLYMGNHGLDSIRYVYEYSGVDPNGIEGIPFVREGKGGKRTAERGEMVDYYGGMKEKSFNARTFATIKEFKAYIEEHYHIISSEWESIVKINSSEGGVEAFFDQCKTTNQLFDRLLIPTVEDSIAGHDPTMFSSMFEKQLASFKNYKKLKETIEENKKIQLQLEEYVSTYEGLHQKELIYCKAKERAKGVWQETLEEKQQFEQEKLQLASETEAWKRSNDQYKLKKMSLDIQLEVQKLTKLEKDYDDHMHLLDESEEMYATKEREYHSLKYAELKEAYQEYEQRLTEIERELQQLDQTTELSELQEQLVEAKSQLLGFFIKKQETIQMEKQDLIFERNPIERELEKLSNGKEQVEVRKKQLEKSSYEIHERIRLKRGEMKGLEDKLLTNPLEENVQIEFQKWMNKLVTLENEMTLLKEEEKRLVTEKRVAEEEKEAKKDEYNQIDKEKGQLDYQLSEAKKKEIWLIERLATVRPQWAKLDSVYFQQNSIITKILEIQEKLDNERDTLLYKERMAYRFVDDHGDQNQYFADTFVERQLQSWKNQYSYVKTGVEYVQSLNDVVRSEKESYPLWPLTLVTTAKEKEKLLGQLSYVSDRLLYPIFVLSTEEAANISSFLDAENAIVEPVHWKSNSNPTTFQSWKEQLVAAAKAMTAQRVAKEDERSKCDQILGEFDSFFKQYPFETIQQWQALQAKKHNELQEIMDSIAKLTEKIHSLFASLSTNEYNFTKAFEEKQQLQIKVQLGEQYLRLEEEVEKEEQRKKETKENLNIVEQELKGINRQLADFAEEKKELDDRIRYLESSLDHLLSEDDYKEVQHFKSIFSNESKKVIKDRIYDLDLKIKQINKSHGEWIAKKEAVKEGIASTEKQMTTLLNEHDDIDEQMTFPTDGKQKMELLRSKISSLKLQRKQLSEEAQEKATLMNTQKGVVLSKKKQFQIDFSGEELISFIELELTKVTEQLQQEKLLLKEKKEFLANEESRVEKELLSIGEAERCLERFIEGHHFNAPHIIAQGLLPDEMNEFTRNRKLFAQKITVLLQQCREAVHQEQLTVDRAKRRFREFCNHIITDVKMRNMALTGIEQKENYDDIVTFKKNMMVSVDRATSYANEHIRQKDVELQSFISHIHSHMLNIVDELKQIPKKTKVKVGDDWKQIFSFTIPEWEAAEGKGRIRDYIDWILEQLQGERYLNEEGQHDDGKVRKALEGWLHSKQLLQTVMNNEMMKVSCRKVTNDNKVTTRSYSWEQSNVWSGGEKWSKNMTLFLGILNYVAEKKQHKQTKMKRHRAVILDNPFGKASSDHVLNPVFFVAEQLGFQIIALTAHAEGKFLQDFFPIIYSCRLRAASVQGANSASKQIMTKEKWLHHAYFQDHEPQTMDRLGETEQMALF